jgi:hypothetical protein
MLFFIFGKLCNLAFLFKRWYDDGIHQVFWDSNEVQLELHANNGVSQRYDFVEFSFKTGLRLFGCCANDFEGPEESCWFGNVTLAVVHYRDRENARV